MPVVIADTTPLRYLAEIDLLYLVPRIFARVYIPTVVHDELQHPSTPAMVRRQVAAAAAWLEVVPVPAANDPGLNALNAGERAAIVLGLTKHADLILIDERKGTAAAMERGLETTGTLGILLRAGELELVDLEDAFRRLRGTSFRYSERLMSAILARRGAKSS